MPSKARDCLTSLGSLLIGLMLIPIQAAQEILSWYLVEIVTAVSFAGTHLTAARLSCSAIYLTPFYLPEFFPRFNFTYYIGLGIFNVRG